MSDNGYPKEVRSFYFNEIKEELLRTKKKNEIISKVTVSQKEIETFAENKPMKKIPSSVQIVEFEDASKETLNALVQKIKTSGINSSVYIYRVVTDYAMQHGKLVPIGGR